MKILIPVDGSENGLCAVKNAVALSAQMKQAPQLLLLNVQWNVAAGNVKLFINQETINDYYREQGAAALEKARAILDEANLAYQYHISIGRPAEAIVQYAEEQKVDQIIIGAQGEESLAKLLLGSVTSKVAQMSKIPVTIAR
ncbi:MAG: UspA domain protein [Gallionellaceae bacterium]|nr:MAG: UspA domain protein [Gallionellaceae bacterium]